MSRDGAFSRAQQTKNWCVGFSFPPPAYAGIHPTLYLFGFRANALNSHSPLLCLALIRGLVSNDAFGTFWGFRQRLSGPPEHFFWAACGRLLGPAKAFGGFRGPSGASGGLRGLRVPLGVRMLGLVVGFASFLAWQPSCLADPDISAFPGHL